jgi:hypothetical protein
MQKRRLTLTRTMDIIGLRKYFAVLARPRLDAHAKQGTIKKKEDEDDSKGN